MKSVAATVLSELQLLNEWRLLYEFLDANWNVTLTVEVWHWGIGISHTLRLVIGHG